jgi:hypothetical protein
MTESFYETVQCCGRVQTNPIALNLEMINNNHDLDFKRQELKQNVTPVGPLGPDMY